MKSLSLLSQVLTVGLSIAIALLFIKPSFEEINLIQTQIDEYNTERLKIENVNTQLAGHVAQLASISPDNVNKLTTYMPPFVDDIAVMRDIQYIVGASGMIFKEVQYAGIDAAMQNAESEDEASLPTAHQFSVVAEGTYSQVKDLFSLLEQNQYPLEVHSAEINPIDGGFITVSASLVTYADTVVGLDNNDS